MDQNSGKQLIFEENKGQFHLYFYFDWIAIPVILLFTIIFDTLFINAIYNNADLTIKNIIILTAINLSIVIGLWIISYQVRGRAKFKLFYEGFIPPIIPRNRRRPKTKHFISADEIESLELVLIYNEPYGMNYVLVKLKDGTNIYILEGHVGRKGLEELMKFKEMHGL
jgi:hypothetical protein